MDLRDLGTWNRAFDTVLYNVDSGSWKGESGGIGGLGLRLVNFGVDFVGIDMWLLLLSCSKVQEWVGLHIFLFVIKQTEMCEWEKM